MWYLKSDTLLIMSAFVVLIMVLRILSKNKIVPYVMPLLELIIIGYISKSLLLFTLIYFACGFIANKILEKYPKRSLFILLSLLAILPFIFVRANYFGFTLPFVIVTIGIAYHILRVVDGFYYIYYAREKIDFLTYLNYIFFLPVFTAGPIFRYRDFVITFNNPSPVDYEKFAWCIKRIIKGFFKKVVLVVILMDVFNHLLAMDYNWYISLAIVFLSYLLIYFDLSGYSDIAIGFGTLAGYKIPENFKKPWNAASFSQFWRTWHASFSDWIREHIFVVVGKKRLKKHQGAMIGFFVMLIMSLWYGFEIPYLIVGLYNGIIMATETLLGLSTFNKRKASKLHYRFRTFVVNFLFAINTLILLVPFEKIIMLLKGFIRL